MKPHHPITLRILALAVTAAAAPGLALADNSTIPTFQAGAGVLSYTFFNLSGSDCTVTAYGTGQNPSAYSSWAQSNGWSNKGNPGNAGFFNPEGLGGDNKNSSSQVSDNYLFYNNYDPLDTSAVPKAAATINNGQTSRVLETSGQLGPVSENQSINYPAVGDSWGIQCFNSNTIVVANLASAASALQSNGPTSYPYNSSKTGWFENAAINPPAEAGCSSATNPCGVGFTAASNQAGNQILNWNVSSSASNYQAMGGLWSGVNYNSSSSTYPAANLLNLPMLPINLSAYVTSQQGNFNPNDSSQYMYYTPIYGGHFTLAVGDPFLISSYAAKILWYTVISTGGVLNDDTTLSSISNNLTDPTGVTPSQPVFSSGSYEYNYVQWLLGSQASSQNYPGAPQLAAQAYQSAYKAASVATSTSKESVWGKIFAGLADAVIFTGVAALTFVPGGDVVVAGVVGAGTAVSGAVVPDMNAAIGNSFTTTTTSSPNAPLSQNAPTVINPTYAATNLLGLLLTNTGVQEQINTLMTFSSNYSALWSNYSINTGNTGTPCSSIEVRNNLFKGSCPNGSDGSNANSGSSPPAGGYTNVYASTQTTTQLSIWDAILTGSDVVNTAGYMEMGSSAGDIASFSPPVQMWNATNGAKAPTTTLPGGLSVNTTFNLNTGTLTVQSYTYTGGDPTTAGSTAAPAAAPTVTIAVSGANPASATYAYDASFASYSASTGILNVSAYSGSTGGNASIDYGFANGTQTIDLTACPVNSNVTLTITPDANNPADASGASGTLSCIVPVTPAVNVTLAYQNCVTDQWATGGVLAAFTTAPNSTTGANGQITLACACVPSYLDGPTTTQSANLLGGVVVGATSAAPNQSCPLPAN